MGTILWTLICSEHKENGRWNGRRLGSARTHTRRKGLPEGTHTHTHTHTQRKDPSKGNGNKLKKRQSYAEKNKFCHIKVQNTSHQQITYKYSADLWSNKTDNTKLGPQVPFQANLETTLLLFLWIASCCVCITNI
jgi:hypothetical protein